MSRFIKDIERCPYVPKDPEYDEWNRKDKQRLKNIEEGYQEIKITANQLLSHPDRKVRNMCLFVLSMLRD